MKRILIGLGVLVVVAAVAIGWKVRPRSQSFYTDALSIRQPVESAETRDILWQAPVRLPPAVNSGDDDYEPRLSADGRTLFFVRGQAGDNADIYVAERDVDGWSVPGPLLGVNSGFDELGPSPSTDGRRLYFYSDRPGGHGGYDLWVVERAGTGWQAPRNLGPLVNSEWDDYGAALTPDGQFLYFATNRPKPLAGPGDAAAASQPAPETPRRRDIDIYIAVSTPDGFGRAEPVSEINTDGNETAPSISPVGDFLYFASDRPGGSGGYDIYRARRLRGGHRPPQNLGVPVNTAANELDPDVGLGGFGLHFSSDRGADSDALATTGDYNLYRAASREVFSETETSREAIDWWRLLREIAPPLLWALAALLLILLLLSLIRDLKDGRLALITKCLLGSLIAHLLILLFLSFWNVTASVVDAFQRRGEIQVALASQDRGDELSLQVRGQLTDVAYAPPAEAEAEQQATAVEMQVSDASTDVEVARSAMESQRRRLVEEEAADARQRPLETPRPDSALAALDDAHKVELDTPATPSPAAESEADSSIEVAHAEPVAPEAPPEHRDALSRLDPSAAVANMSVDRSATPRQETWESDAAPADVQRRDPDLPATDPSVAAVETEVALDVATPSDESPTPVAEPDATLFAARLEPSPVAMTSSGVPTTQPVALASEVSLTPEAPAGDASDASSFADAVEARDVAPPDGGVQRSDHAALAFLEPPHVADVAVPAMPACGDAASNDVTEATPAVAFAGATATPADPPATMGPRPGESRMTRMDPADPDERPIDQTFVSAGSANAAEAPAHDVTLASARQPAGSAATPVEIEVALPSPSGSSADTTAEPALRVTTLGGAPARKRETMSTRLGDGAADEAPVLAAARHQMPKSAETDFIRELSSPSDARASRSPPLAAIPPARTPAEPGAIALALALPLPTEESSAAAGAPEPAPPRLAALNPESRFAPLPLTAYTTLDPNCGASDLYAVSPARPAGDTEADVDLVARMSAPTDATPHAPTAGWIDPEMADTPALEAVEVALAVPTAGLTRAAAEPSLAGIAAAPVTIVSRPGTHDHSEARPDVTALAALNSPRHVETADLVDRLVPEIVTAESTDPSSNIVPLLLAATASAPEPIELSLRLPIAPSTPLVEFAQRAPEKRLPLVKRMGGSEKTERAVDLALAWLARHQSPNGRWDPSDFDDDCDDCDGDTDIEADMALTGMALLCFLGADHTHVKDGPYRHNVNRGLKWLTRRQRGNGDLRGSETMYSHGIAAIALSEAYGMTGDRKLEDPVRRAVDFIIRGRHKRLGGWRYDPGQVGDTSVLGWQVMALKSARMAGVAVPEVGFDSARRWLEYVESRSRPGLYSYRRNRSHSVSMTAEGMFSQQLLGLPRDDERMRSAADFIARDLPDWDSQPNTYSWYYTTLALYHHQGPQWRRWNDALVEQLVDNQRTDGGAAGSWDVNDRWSRTGGRIYQTAICALMLEVYYRYLPLYSHDQVRDAAGTIRGIVTDARTGRPLRGATVRLDLADRRAVTAISAAGGSYHLYVPKTPDYFALSASHDRYVPDSTNIEAARLEERGIVVDFALQPLRSSIIAVESDPEVHHLGNDRFEGRINSQFQKDAEGIRHDAEFEVTARQLPPNFSRAEVWLLAKGVQCPHKIYINGELLEARLDDSPRDGSFGAFVGPFDISLLEEGTNTITIKSIICRSDRDDFEFVNVQIRLKP